MTSVNKTGLPHFSGKTRKQEQRYILYHFESFLRRYAQNKFLISTRSPLIDILRQAASGTAGIALGGSRVRGLWSEESDVDYVIFLNDQSAKTGGIEQRVDLALTRASFRPCELSHVYNYGQPLEANTYYSDPIDSPEARDMLNHMILSPFMDFFIEGEVGKVRDAALKYLERYQKHTSYQQLKDVFRELLGTDPKYVVTKFILKLPREHLRYQASPDDGLIPQMREMAEIYTSEREKRFPFPRAVLEVLK